MALHIVIMAGGSGTRLWPMSRKDLPKQLQNLIGDKSLIQQTVERVMPLVDSDHIYIGTVAQYVPEMQRQLPGLAKDHFITEPSLKNNAAAIGLNAVHLQKQDAEAVMVSLHSDHAVTNVQNFHHAIRLASQVLKKHPQVLVTVGIKPTYASTELGYIHMDGALDGNEDVFSVKQFIEKPDAATAERYVADGHYLWNAGYFVWRVDTLLKLYQQFLPNTYEHLMAIQAAIGTPQYQAVLEEHYDQVDEIAIDYAIMEHAPHIAVIPADLGWSDIGTWSSLHDIIRTASGEHVVSKGHHVHHATEDSLVYTVGDKLVATVGLKNVIVVDTPDVLLVADKSRAHEVKKIIEQLKQDETKHKYL